MEKEQKILMGLVVLTFAVLLLNSVMITQVITKVKASVGATGAAGVTGAAVGVTGMATSTSEIIPHGIPEIYGKELGISFDDVSPNDLYKSDLTINKLAQIDRSVELQGKDKERYINALYKLHDGISCEYCCGAQSIISENGQAACGCAHSYAMRGLAKYLLTEHGDEFTDEEILEEVGKWKVLFFPTQMELKAGILDEQGIEFNYINIASNKYRDIEQGKTAGGMIGGC